VPDQLRAATVGLHEVWLLEQRPAKILRASQAIGRPSRGAEAQFWPAFPAAGHWPWPLRIPKPTARTI
jgi:hypothetical protein